MDSDERLKFEFDETFSSLQESRKKLNSAMLRLLVLLVTLTLITLGSPSNDKIEIPFIGLNLSKWSSVHALSVIAHLLLYSLFSMHCYCQLLKSKLNVLAKESGFDSGVPWNVGYPTAFEFVRLNAKLNSNFLPFLYILLLIASILGPFVCLTYSWCSNGFSSGWLVSLICCLILAVASGVAIQGTGVDEPRIAELDNAE